MLLILWPAPCFAQTFSSADPYSGVPEMFTEECQKEFIKTYLDVAVKKGFVAGMHVYAFSDFKTGQGVIRFGGINDEGVVTRNGKPKAAAYYLRSGWGKKTTH